MAKGVSAIPSAPPVIADIGCVAAPHLASAIGLPCRSGRRRRAHELVSRHPNMLGICVGGKWLDDRHPKVLLEKNPGSSSSALLRIPGPWISMLAAWSMCAHTRARTHFAHNWPSGKVLRHGASHHWIQYRTGHWSSEAFWAFCVSDTEVERIAQGVRPVKSTCCISTGLGHLGSRELLILDVAITQFCRLWRE